MRTFLPALLTVILLALAGYLFGLATSGLETAPVPWSSDPLKAAETRALVERGVRTVPPMQPAHR